MLEAAEAFDEEVQGDVPDAVANNANANLSSQADQQPPAVQAAASVDIIDHEAPAANGESFLGEVQTGETDLGQLSKLGHQECSWILTEIEGICQNTGDNWLETGRIAPMLAKQMGYEDVDELEDALKGTLAEFIALMPHFETQRPQGVHQFRMRPSQPSEPKCIRVRVESVPDLYTVILKPGNSRIIIPSLEFEIGENEEKVVDTIYNHIAAAILNLSLQSQQGGWGEEILDRVTDTLMQLNALLDVHDPFDVIIRDRTGTSIVKPEAKGEIFPYEHYHSD